MLKFSAVLIAIGFAVLGANAGPSDPEPRTEDWWVSRHAEFRAFTLWNPDIPILFYGDSITEGWGGMQWPGNGDPIFAQYYAPLGVTNYGIGGDRTEHVLWRILDGELNGLRPKLVVLKIGTNNLGSASNEEVAGGVRTLVNTFRQALPGAKVLLLGILPRGDGDSSWLYEQIIDINERIRELHDGSMVFFLDMFASFSEAWGAVPDELFYDKLHLTTAGYQKWADVMNPLFNQLIA